MLHLFGGPTGLAVDTAAVGDITSSSFVLGSFYMRNFNIQDELVNIHDKPVNIHDELVNIQDGSFVKSRKYHHADTGKGTYFDCFAAQLCKF